MESWIGGLGDLAIFSARTFGWTLRLMCRKIERLVRRPRSPIPMRGVDGGPATHEGGRTETSTVHGRTIPLLVAG